MHFGVKYILLTDELYNMLRNELVDYILVYYFDRNI